MAIGLFSISGENGSVSLWLTQAFGLFPQEVLFYFYYPLKLRRAGALAILTSSLPPVCHLLHKFLGSLGI
jgi:hypothetical protein